MINVFLLTHTSTPEKVVAAAAKLCYSKKNVGELMDNLISEKASEFVEMLSEIGHESPIEHVSFTFGIEGVSRSLLAQITRHRIASYSVQSQRYVAKSNFDYVTPPAISDNPQALAIYINAMKEASKNYDALSQILTKQHVDRLVLQGENEEEAIKKAKKLANEDARFVLPNSCDTKMVVTMNARSLLNFFKHRCCNRAQWEIHQLADKMLELVKEVAPTIFENAGPPCIKGACPEKNMTCGLVMEVRQKYKGETSLCL